MNDLKDKILAMIKDDLEDIEVAVVQNLNPYLDIVSRTANHILFSGGKRLRPLLMVLSARICGYNGGYDRTLSTIFEYLHAATLLHDDLVDDATLRRGRPVAHSIWGNPIAILTGDFLLARASSIAAETGCLKIIRTIAAVAERMSQGEIHQFTRKGSLNLSEKEYLEIIGRKTATLFQGACRVGALVADASEKEELALAEYGLNFGAAFQMGDDLLDYTSDTVGLGKEIGADLKEGKLTLPVVHSLKEADSKDRSLMERIIKNSNFSVSDFKTFVDLLKKYGGLAYTKRLAAKHIADAKDALSIFEPSKTKEILLDVADYALVRKA